MIRNIAVVQPSEYRHGQPQWNAYPFIRISRGEIDLGSIPEGVYRINKEEARHLARALLSAAHWLDEHHDA